MKEFLSRFVVISVVSIALLSCKNNAKENSKKVENAAAKQIEYPFEDGHDWQLTWSDEFDSSSIDENNWNLQVVKAGRFNDEWQRYTNSPKNAYIEDGNLIIKAIHESEVIGMDQYTSARMNTANKQTFKYGKIMARIKLPFGHGIWPAFWMLGANIDENGGDTPWPQSGEIDILELYGSRNDSIVEANIHYADESNSHAMMGAESFKSADGRFADDFHIFGLEWDANRIVWTVDNKEYASTPITADELSEFHKEFFILLNVAVGNKWAGRPDTTSVFPQFMHVDWVRVYNKKE